MASRARESRGSGKVEKKAMLEKKQKGVSQKKLEPQE